jgi:glutamine amidotransferase
MTQRLVLIDYGRGNLWSVYCALRHCDIEPIVSADPKVIQSADILVLPGVGSFRTAMNRLRSTGIADALSEVVINKRRKIMGICLGLQLFATEGDEDGTSNGLGFLDCRVDRFSPGEVGELKVPHIGFNSVIPSSQSILFEGISRPADFYFVHSYRILSSELPGYQAVCKHGVEFIAAYEHMNIFGTQFHPEKSQTNGLRVINNFLKA